MSVLINAAMLAEWSNKPELVVFDVRYSLQDSEAGLRMYEQGHVPGAQYASICKDLSGEIIPGKTGRHPLPDSETFVGRMQQWGLNQNSCVVLYDDGSHFMVPRMWWMLSVWFGLSDIYILHGGIRAWENAGYSLSTDIPAVRATDFSPEANNDVLVQIDDILPFVEEGGVLADARALERFVGDVEPLDSIAGHIPGAVCQPYSETVGSNGYFLESEALKGLFSAWRGRDVVCYCGSGVSACQNILAMTLAGMPQPRLYAGSWSEWIADASRPVATKS
ncbi:sulfurtransferase [Parendozoicomonas sp. Alg238-R29]|uniref:sulfurtransferase n=1 Tax=Parendozoicomonas sp. Alg238-R29 TaxID=2993446 RepID=UPI00248ECA62|nr:sulfurtransferase [Parendozoicomonas sp. Alg238-R29]